ncbi:MAG: hypothetical protein HW403_664 [Dehalococcoidia bacterium]|nr:hypothetical protein [Dehalococcoidia bacterium]
MADGRVVEYDVGVVNARINGKERPTLCIFADPNTEPLIGVFTLEGFLLGIDPVNQELIPIIGRLKFVVEMSIEA